MSPSRVPTAREAEEMADALIENVWSPVAPGRRHVPVDPIAIAHEIGLDVFDADLPDEVSGRIERSTYGGDVAIFLNREHSVTRARFTSAHELGHYMLRRGDEDEFTFTDYRGPLASTGQSAEEVFANQFAA
ncbi:MAG TPA: ImmA/IrrE family metallo-endopeptidase, partial [Iamia sp.]|nr:ImmA/IrrE family metallo-endopeptidase [Iamia sp.]